MSERRTQTERTAEARQRLLAAAIKLLGERGYSGTTLAEIGREAGMSRGLVTHHFGSKDACIAAAIDEIRQDAGRRLQATARGARGLAAVDHLIASYLGSLREGDAHVRAMYVTMVDAISTAPVLLDAVARTNALLRKQIRTWLADAQSDGELPETADTEAFAVVIEGILRGVGLQWLVDPDRVDLDRTTRAAQAAYRAGLALNG